MKMTTSEKIVVFALVVFVVLTLWVGYSKSFPKFYNEFIETETTETATLSEKYYVTMSAVVELREEEEPGIYRYEILSEDGNVWVIASSEKYEEGETLIVEFLAEKNADRAEWEILEASRA